MRRYIIVSLFCLMASPVFADTIDLRSGKTVAGKIIEQGDDFVRLDQGNGIVITYYVDDMVAINGEEIVFQNGGQAAPAQEGALPDRDSSFAVASGSDITKGFHGIKWGTDISTLNDIIVHHAGTACGQAYRIEDDDLTLFGLPVYSIRYDFHQGKFFYVIIHLSGYQDPDVMVKKLEEQYGASKEERFGVGMLSSATHTWRIGDVEVRLSRVLADLHSDHDPPPSPGNVIFTYVPISEKCEQYLGHKMMI